MKTKYSSWIARRLRRAKSAIYDCCNVLHVSLCPTDSSLVVQVERSVRCMCVSGRRRARLRTTTHSRRMCCCNALHAPRDIIWRRAAHHRKAPHPVWVNLNVTRTLFQLYYLHNCSALLGLYGDRIGLVMLNRNVLWHCVQSRS